MTYNEFLTLTDSTTPTLVYFYAMWCKPCRGMSAELDKLKVQFDAGINLLHIDIDRPDNYKVTQAYNIYSVPTVIIFRSGAPVWRISGEVTADYLRRIIDKLLAAEAKSAVTPQNRRR